MPFYAAFCSQKTLRCIVFNCNGHAVKVDVQREFMTSQPCFELDLRSFEEIWSKNTEVNGAVQYLLLSISQQQCLKLGEN